LVYSKLSKDFIASVASYIDRKKMFLCFQTFQHFLAFKSSFIWSRKFQS